MRLHAADPARPRICRTRRQTAVRQDKGRIVTAFLESFFQRYVEFDFTASLEEQLDKISAGELSWLDVLRDFWTRLLRRRRRDQGLRVAEVIDALNELLGPHIFPEKEDGSDPRKCPSCDTVNCP
jgi:DNA topoisomerase-1